MIDSRSVEKWCKDTPVLMNAKQTLGFNLQYMTTMNVYSHFGTRISSNGNSSMKKTL
jgi:hypothetical protein